MRIFSRGVLLKSHDIPTIFSFNGYLAAVDPLLIVDIVEVFLVITDSRFCRLTELLVILLLVVVHMFLVVVHKVAARPFLALFSDDLGE